MQLVNEGLKLFETLHGEDEKYLISLVQKHQEEIKQLDGLRQRSVRIYFKLMLLRCVLLIQFCGIAPEGFGKTFNEAWHLGLHNSSLREIYIKGALNRGIFVKLEVCEVLAKSSQKSKVYQMSIKLSSCLF